MKKWTWFLTCFIVAIQLEAQIKTTELTIEATSNATLIDGKVGIGTPTPGIYNLAANYTTFSSLLDVNGEVLAREGLRVVGPSIGWGQEINYNVFTASLHQNARNTGAMTGWVAKVHSQDASDPMKLSFFDGYTSVYSAANNALLDQLDVTPVLTLESHNNRVGIGTTSPQEKLHINGNIRGSSYGGSVRIQTAEGFVDVGPQNDGYSHFGTDRPRFYFNQKVVVDGAVSTYNEDLVLETAETPRMTILNSNGYAGIGISNPQDILHVPDGNIRIGTDLGDYGQIHYSGGGMNIMNRWASNAAFVKIGAGNHLNALTVTGNGQVGIKNTSPSYDLDVLGNWALRQDGYFYNATAYAYESSSQQYLHFRTLGGKGYVGMNSTNDLILQTNQGKVGIGTVAPQATLHVNGTIKAPATDWSDFVFDEGYELPTLEEVEDHIESFGHLKDIPSEEEVMKNDVDLTQMDSRLLQKIEELTLYLIEQNKKIEALEEKVKRLEE